MLLFHEGLEADQVRRMADAVMQKCSGCCAVFSSNGDGSYKYAIGELNGDLRQFTNEMNAAPVSYTHLIWEMMWFDASC